MIRCNMGELKLEGSKELIKAEFSTIVFALKNEKILTEEDINQAVKYAIETKEEDIKNVSDEFIDKLKKILEILED